MTRAINWDEMYIEVEIDRLEELRGAIQKWSDDAKAKLDKTINDYKTQHSVIPEGVWDSFGDRAFVDQDTERILYAGLASAVASCAEHVVENFCQRERVLLVNKAGKTINRPNWGHKKSALEQYLKVDFLDLEGFDLNKLARLLSNCFKHSDSCVDARLAERPGFTKGAKVEYEKQDWKKMIVGTGSFLLALAKKIPLPKDELTELG